MRNLRWIAAVVAVMAGAMAARGAAPAADDDVAGRVAAFVPADALFVGHLDLARADPKAVEARLVAWAKALGAGEAGQAQVGAVLRQGRVMDPAWREAFLKAGGRHLYLVTGLGDVPFSPGVVVAPVEGAAGADPAAMASLLFSGRADGPSAREGDVSPQAWPTVAKAIDAAGGRKAVVMGSALQLRALPLAPGAATAAARPEWAAAWQEAGAAGADVPLHLLLLPTDDVRKSVEALLPILPKEIGGGPVTVLTRGVAWAQLSAGVGEKPSLRLVIQSPDAAAAEALARKLRDLLAIAAADKEVRRALPDLEVKAAPLVPKVEGTKLVTTLDAAAIDKLVADVFAPALATAREQARTVQSLNHIKQLIMCCMMHGVDNRNDWPETLEEAVRKYADGNRALLVNPRDPKGGGYVYVRPAGDAATRRPAETIVLHEPLDLPGATRLGAGFADGHVEMLPADEIRKRLAAQQGR